MTARIHVGEYEIEPIRGLPETPPRDERILWQGSPSWRGLALRALHARKVAIYFGLLVAWRVAIAFGEGESLRQAAGSVGALAGLGVAAVAILAGIAWLQARATVYTITNRRVVMRFGVALTLSVNLPFRELQAASWKEHADGTADLPLAISGAQELGWMVLWPHVRPWRFGRSLEPMLRAVPDGRAVAELLQRAVAASAARRARPLDVIEEQGVAMHRNPRSSPVAAAMS